MPRRDRQSFPTPPEGPGREVSDGETWIRLLRYSHIFASAVREILEVDPLQAASPLPISVSQFHLLRLMTLNGQHQVGEIAGFLGVSSPAATKNIDKLERLGLVVRARSRGDRRATLLSVSPRARRLVRRYEKVREERLRPVLEGFRSDEIGQLAELLERFAIALLRQGDSEEGVCLRCAAHIQEACPVGLIRRGCPYETLRGRRGRAVGPKETG
jgi:MarR family transcriptional regulator, organic hydroperoxide resistance regulator